MTDLGPEDVEIVDYPKKKCLRKEENYGPDSYASCTTQPGEMLLEEFLNPMSLTQRELSGAIHVSYQGINDIGHGRRSVTPSTALRLAKFFNISADVWMNLQMRWDMYHAQQEETAILKKIEPVRTP